jgi:predicted dehydrogenase
MIARDDIDSVDVCLHNRFHMPVTVDVLRAGKNAYCEKPMSWTYADARTMYDVARETGKMLHIQLAELYTPQTRAAKKLIDAGQLGRPVLCQVHPLSPPRPPLRGWLRHAGLCQHGHLRRRGQCSIWPSITSHA